ncbi:MAG: neutral/alkaline non-lysosomal ceramidase N-terminal domain-containing protein [Candidatus Rokubacteria bacterium]|nr:neutral/alkaline non-lysosomal ceramidase N-terminal domain-containing protein [Candidatus Rokubacteria bacterium]
MRAARTARLAVLLAGVAALAPGGRAGAGPAPACPECLRAGAASVALRVPAGTPLGGYGALARRLLVPDVLGRHPHAFWFKPAAGARDAPRARAVVLELPSRRLVWVSVDLVAVDRDFTHEVARRLSRSAARPATLILSASHTHSGPGAFIGSRLMGWLALDRFDAEVRDALVESVAAAVRQADVAARPALVGAAAVTAPPLTRGRLGRELDPEIVVVKLTTPDGAPIALLWNYAIHGTALGPKNLRLSGDVMGVASAELERRFGAPVLFVNGAVGDVSPAGHGEAAAARIGRALADAVQAGWERARAAPAASIEIARRRVALPSPWLSLRNCTGRWMPRFVTAPLGSAFPADADLTAVALGDVAWITVPGELQAALGLAIKREGRDLFAQTFIAGLSNDYLGYFVAPADYDRPAYVTCATLYGPKAGECLASTAAELLYQLRGRDRPLTRLPGPCDFTPNAR